MGWCNNTHQWYHWSKLVKKTDLFSELVAQQRDASGAGTQDSLISDSSSSEIWSDEKRHSEDLGGERGGRVERGEGGIPVQNLHYCINIKHVILGHMEKQEMEIKWKLETETGNGTKECTNHWYNVFFRESWVVYILCDYSIQQLYMSIVCTAELCLWLRIQCDWQHSCGNQCCNLIWFMWEGLGTRLVAIWPWEWFWNEASVPTLAA